MADKVHCVRKTLRLMPEEAKMLAKKACDNGMNEAEYIRLLISQKPNDYPEVRKILEATSNTDAYSEQQINGLLDTRLKDKTVIVITHKKEVLSKVDQIVVLKEGVVADLGRYDDLVGKSDELNVMLEKAE